MIISQKHYSKNVYVTVVAYNFEIVKGYTFLGTTPTNKNKLRPAIPKIITNANRAYCVLLTPLKNQSVLRAENIKICKILIRPVATDGAESWTLNKDISKWLAAFEKNVLRMSGGIK